MSNGHAVIIRLKPATQTTRRLSDIDYVALFKRYAKVDQVTILSAETEAELDRLATQAEIHFGLHNVGVYIDRNRGELPPLPAGDGASGPDRSPWMEVDPDTSGVREMRTILLTTADGSQLDTQAVVSIENVALATLSEKDDADAVLGWAILDRNHAESKTSSSFGPQTDSWQWKQPWPITFRLVVSEEPEDIPKGTYTTWNHAKFGSTLDADVGKISLLYQIKEQDSLRDVWLAVELDGDKVIQWWFAKEDDLEDGLFSLKAGIPYIFEKRPKEHVAALFQSKLAMIRKSAVKNQTI